MRIGVVSDTHGLFDRSLLGIDTYLHHHAVAPSLTGKTISIVLLPI
jgi:hypothetical protein